MTVEYSLVVQRFKLYLDFWMDIVYNWVYVQLEDWELGLILFQYPCGNL
ncbi:MAG: hypothetical protein ACUVUF_08475 [Candidatus Bathycorpusculaceae bacterium]